MKIQEVFQDGVVVPSFSEVFYPIQLTLDEPNSSFEEMSETVENGPELSHRLLLSRLFEWKIK